LKDVTCGTNQQWFRVAAEIPRLYLRSGWLIIYILNRLTSAANARG
jgi:hypothetical protein